MNKEINPIYPDPKNFVKSSLQNRLILELDSPVSAVYNLVGDPGNMSKYSAGLEKVETKMESGKHVSYTCYFKPVAEGEKGMIHTESVVWQEANLGWASMANEQTEFGYTESFSSVTLIEKKGKTILKWDMYYDHENQEMLDMNRTTLVEVFDDIADQLIERFEGRIMENSIKSE